MLDGHEITVSRGPVDTPLLAKLITAAGTTDRPGVKDTALQRMATPEEMAKTICFALSDDSSYTTGSVFTVDGAMMA